MGVHRNRSPSVSISRGDSKKIHMHLNYNYKKGRDLADSRSTVGTVSPSHLAGPSNHVVRFCKNTFCSTQLNDLN